MRLFLELIDLDRRTIEISGRVSIGREEGSDVILADKSVSIEHARIDPHELGYVLVDLDTTNGTSTGGVPLVPQAPRLLVDGARVTFGRIRASTRLRADVAMANRDGSTAELALHMIKNADEVSREHPSVVVVEGPELGLSLDLGARPSLGWVVGRDPGSDLRLSDPALSGKHAEVRLVDGGGVEIRDAGSRHGTRLEVTDLVAREWTPWPPNACVALGTTVLALREPRPNVTLEVAAPPGESAPEVQPEIPEPPSHVESVADEAQPAGAAPIAKVADLPAGPTAKPKRPVRETVVVVGAIMLIVALTALVVWIVLS